MPDKEIFVLKIVWKKSIASLHRLTQAVQRANLRRTAGDPTWVFMLICIYVSMYIVCMLVMHNQKHASYTNMLLVSRFSLMMAGCDMLEIGM